MIRTNESLGVTISWPDRITVRQRLAYLGVLGNPTDDERFERAFMAAAEVLDVFECEAWPKPALDPKRVYSPREIMRATLAADLDTLDGAGNLYLIVLWVGAEIMLAMSELDTLPKN